MPNIELPDDFPERLRAFRTAGQLAESELAAKAGLTYKTIRDLETGKRRRVMERTVMVLAAALEMTTEKLLGIEPPSDSPPETPPAPQRRRWSTGFMGVAVTLVVVVAGLLVATRYAHKHANWDVGRDVLTVRDAIFGITLWEAHAEAQFTFCEESPWSPHHLLVGLGSKSPDGGRLLCLERATGDTIWSVGPDIEAVVRAFGPEIVNAANFSARGLKTANLDGDGTPDLVVNFMHGPYYPSVLAWIDRDGNRVAQYANKGHLTDYTVVDCDGDGLDEVVAWGTNNALDYQGGTVIMLDADHWRGASIDSCCSPASTEPDSALLRLVLPQYPEAYMNIMGHRRLTTFGLQAYRGPGGATMFSVGIGGNTHQGVVLTLDDQLRPLGARSSDTFLAHMKRDWPDSLVQGAGPSDEVWLARWLTHHRRFEAGHRPVVAE